MSRQAWLISAICSSVRRSAASAVASGSMMWRNSCTVRRNDFAVGRRRVPAQHVAIEQVPAFPRLDPAADLGAGTEQALGHQHLDRFAHRRAADVEGFRPFRLVRQDGSGRIVAAHDPQADLAGERGMHAGAGACAAQLAPVVAAGAAGVASAWRRCMVVTLRFSPPAFAMGPIVLQSARLQRARRRARITRWMRRRHGRARLVKRRGRASERARVPTSGCRCRPYPWCIRRGR